MVFPVVGGNQSTGDFVTNSLRLNDDDSPYLERSLSSPNTDKFTVSCWVKLCGGRSQIANIGKRLTGEAGDNRSIDIEQSEFAYGRLGINAYNGVADANVAAYNSNTGQGPLIKDSSAWYHFVYAFDTGQGTAANRFKWYINGVLQSGYNTTTTPSQNADLFDSSGSGFRIGRAYNTETRYADMYVAEYYYVDGQQYDHTYFGEFNDNGVWVPVEKGKGAGGAITFGTNGFYLQFKETGTSANASGIGADTSGNDNHLTPTNLAALDITTDTPQNNFCTLNPLDPVQGAVYSEGNCKTVTNSSNRNYVTGTFGLTSGKWYWEAKLTAVTSDANDQAFFGIADLDDRGVNSTGQSLGDRANEVGWHQEEGKYQRNNSWSSAHTASWGIGDICAIALDADNNRVTIAKNGQWADGSGNADESSPTAFVTYTASTMTPAMGEGGGGTEATWECNFGNSAFSISSGNADANGYGNFEYAVPSGYYALCTKNLAEYG
jgi:hypothetical protein